jgi:hypothetical protein
MVLLLLLPLQEGLDATPVLSLHGHRVGAAAVIIEVRMPWEHLSTMHE